MKALGKTLVINILTISSHHVTMFILDRDSSLKDSQCPFLPLQTAKESSEHYTTYFIDFSLV